MEGWGRLGWAAMLQGEARRSTSCECRVTRLGRTPRADPARGFPTQLQIEGNQDQVGGASHSSPARECLKTCNRCETEAHLWNSRVHDRMDTYCTDAVGSRRLFRSREASLSTLYLITQVVYMRRDTAPCSLNRF
jgi:hypothetical protein